MKTLIKNTIAIFAMAASFSLAAQQNIVFMDRVLVIVNEDVITQSEFDYRLQTVMREFDKSKPVPDDLHKQLLDGMVSDRLQVQEANRRGIEIGDQELAQAIERFAGQQNVSSAQLRVKLESEGQPFEMFRESVRDSLTISRFTDYYARTRVVVPDYEINTFMDSNNLNDDNSEYNVAHILIKNPDVNAALAQQVRDQIEGGLSFQQAVLTYSEATDAQAGGIIGWRTPEQLPEVFLSAIKNLEAGQVSQVVASPNGLHILKLLDRKGDKTEIIQTQVSHILIKAESQVAKSQASKKLFDLRQRILAGESFEDLARIYSDDTGSAANGGSLGWVSPGEMVQPFEDAFQKISLNQVSQPINTQFGMHILVVEDRRKKNVTEQIARGRAENILRQQRADREFGQWVRELLEGAYVEHVSKPSIAAAIPVI
ncbi:MAG: peptidyl-prolyl cis-trans isomerase SurA [Arenicella sp.]|jgi:peptidyl-prolyl cis-trans isomerase SurA